MIMHSTIVEPRRSRGPRREDAGAPRRWDAPASSSVESVSRIRLLSQSPAPEAAVVAARGRGIDADPTPGVASGGVLRDDVADEAARDRAAALIVVINPEGGKALDREGRLSALGTLPVHQRHYHDARVARIDVVVGVIRPRRHGGSGHPGV